MKLKKILPIVVGFIMFGLAMAVIHIFSTKEVVKVEYEYTEYHPTPFCLFLEAIIISSLILFALLYRKWCG